MAETAAAAIAEAPPPLPGPDHRTEQHFCGGPALMFVPPAQGQTLSLGAIDTFLAHIVDQLSDRLVRHLVDDLISLNTLMTTRAAVWPMTPERTTFPDTDLLVPLPEERRMRANRVEAD